SKQRTTPHYVSVVTATSTSSDEACGCRATQQADSGRASHQRDYSQKSPPSGHGKDGSRFSGRVGQDGLQARNRYREVIQLSRVVFILLHCVEIRRCTLYEALTFTLSRKAGEGNIGFKKFPRPF